MNKWIYLCCALSLIGAGCDAARADDAQVAVDFVTDSRSLPADFGSNQLRVVVKIESPEVAQARAIRGVVASATDNTGRQLNNAEKRDKWDELRPKTGADKNRASVYLRVDNPSRAAQSLRQIAGHIELYLPQRDPKSVVTVANIGQKSGQTLDDATLKEADLKITFLDKAQVERLKAEILNPPATPQIRPDLQVFGRAIREAMGAELLKNDRLNPKAPVLRIEDPQGRLVDIAFEGAQGQPLKSGVSVGFQGHKIYQFEQPLPPDARLKISVATPQSVVEVPFDLKEIALP